LPLLAASLPLKEDIPCGTQAPGNEPIHVDGTWRVVGGEHAKPHSWPWAAALMKDGPYPDAVYCGATLIDKRWLISAAHCFSESKMAADGYRVKLGADDHGPSPDPNEPSQQVVGIEKFWVHPNHSRGVDNDFDITLIKLDADVTLNEFVRPVCVPKGTDRLQGGDKVATIGWGVTDPNNPQDEPKLLQQVVLDVIDQQTCKDDWEPNGGELDETMVCAGNQTFGGVSSCFGDSGGALIAKRDNAWVHYGIVSWGARQCGAPKLPGVYGYVPLFIDWVHSVIESQGYRLQ